MRVVVNSQALAGELRMANKIAPTKPAIAILGHVLLTAADGQLSLNTTDSELGLATRCEAQVAVPGALTLPVTKLLSLVEQFPDADVTFTAERAAVTVQCASFKSRLQMLSADDFPVQPEVEGLTRVMPAATLRALYERVRYAVNVNSQQHILRGVLVTVRAGGVALIALDGKRLAMAASTGQVAPDGDIALPASTLDALKEHLTEGTVSMTIGQRNAFFEAGGRLLISRLNEGKYPAYERIIPKSNSLVVTMERMSARMAFKRVSLVSEDNRATYVNLEPGRMTLSSAAPGLGSARSSGASAALTPCGLPAGMSHQGGANSAARYRPMVL